MPLDLAEALVPMLASIVQMSGAATATLRIVGPDGAVGAPVAVAGRPLPGAAGSWCSACGESRVPDSDCVSRALCGGAETVVPPALAKVCRHVVTVPLAHRGETVGTLGLLFSEPCEIPPAVAPVLTAVAHLLGVALDNARLAAENLRMSLMHERQMMANEVHDSLAQALTYMRMRMSLLSDAIRQRDELRAFKYWSDVDDSLTNAHRRLRELITYFRSRMDPHGLLHAMRQTAETFEDRTGIALRFDNRVPGFCLSPDREVEVFHIVQEALANVCRHAHARNVDVRLDRAGGGEGYEIAIADDGVGLPASVRRADEDDGGHYGMAIMRERARRIGGTLTLESARGAGTCVRLAIPATGAANGNVS